MITKKLRGGRMMLMDNRVVFNSRSVSENKVLVISDPNSNAEEYLAQKMDISPEHMLLFKNFGPVISQPYGCLMRNIIIAVYQEKIREIFIIGTKEAERNLNNHQGFIAEIYEEGVSEETIRTVDYLMKHVNQGSPWSSVSDWLEGNTIVTDGIKQSVNMICHHPLISPKVKIHGFLLDTKNGTLMPIDR
jgi:carbonic anhydrase